MPERRTNNEFKAQNPLEKAKIIRKEEWGAGTKLRKSSVAIGQGDKNDSIEKQQAWYAVIQI